jgi:hypothetical protein
MRVSRTRLEGHGAQETAVSIVQLNVMFSFFTKVLVIVDRARIAHTNLTNPNPTPPADMPALWFRPPQSIALSVGDG